MSINLRGANNHIAANVTIRRIGHGRKQLRMQNL